MGKTAHFRLPRPELGEEHNVVFLTHHGCSYARVLGPVLEDEDVDLLLFPVGNVGYTMPYGIPFDVESLEPCRACGTYLRAWFEWTQGSVHGRYDEDDDGALILPDEGLAVPGEDFEVVVG